MTEDSEHVDAVAAEVKATAEMTAAEVKTAAEVTAASLAQVVIDTATAVRVTAERNAADVAALVTDTAAALKKSTEETARVVKAASDVNAQFAPVLVKSLDVLLVAVKELNSSSVSLRDQAASEIDLLKSRTKYFVMMVALAVVIVLVSGVNLWVSLH